MTYISLDPKRLQHLITNLTRYATSSYKQRGYVKHANELQGYPTDLTQFQNRISSTVGILEEKTKELQARLDSAKAANESGITPMGANGTISYFIPDGEDDTTKNALNYNHVETVKQAREDAKALYQARYIGSEDGRTFTEILEGMKKRRDDPAYSAALIVALGKQTPRSKSDSDKNGAERFLDLLNHARNSCTLKKVSPEFETMSHILAAASRKKNGAAQLAKQVYQASDSNYTSRISLNIAFSECSLSCGTDFLTHLANAYEKDNSDKTKQYSKYVNYSEYDGDVLGGVLHAMGNNREAARRYLGGEGTIGSDGGWKPTDKMRQRWKSLMHRDWNETGRTGFTAAMAGAVPDRSLSKDPAERARATWVASQSLGYGASVNKGDYTDGMKRNLSVVLANCREEIHSVANGGGTLGLMIPGNYDPKDPDKHNKDALATVLYRIMDNQDAVTTVSSAVSDYALNKVPDPTNMAELNHKYVKAAEDTAFLRDIAYLRAEDNKASEDEKDKMINTISSTFIAVGGAAIGPAKAIAAPLGYEATTSLYQSLSANKVNKEKRMNLSAQPGISNAEYLATRQVTEAISRGFVNAPPEKLYDSKGNLISPTEYKNNKKNSSDNYVATQITDQNGHVVQPKRYNSTFGDGITVLQNQINNPELTNGVQATRNRAITLREPISDQSKISTNSRSRDVAIDKS